MKKWWWWYNNRQKIGKTNIKTIRGGETAICKVNVVYSGITIDGNKGSSVSNVNLIIE